MVQLSLNTMKAHNLNNQFPKNEINVVCTFQDTRNTCTQQPLARLPNLFSVITVILLIMHGSILAVTIPPGNPRAT